MSVTFVNPSAPSQPAAPVSVSFDVQYVTAPASPICCGSAAAAPAAAKQMRVTYYDLNGKVIATQNQAIGNQVGYSFHFSFSPTTGPGVHSYAISLVGGPFPIPPIFFLKDLAYQPKYALQATNQTPHLLIKGKPPTPEIAYLGTSAAKTAHLTLGGTYRIRFGLTSQTTMASGAQKIHLQPIPSKFALIPNTVHMKSSDGKIDPRDLFPGHVIYMYAWARSGKYHQSLILQATHLGTEQLTITPKQPKGQSTPLKPIKIKLSVARPASLGTKFNKLDKGLETLASDTGVPPQMIKGQVRQESDFKAMAWRYEPVNITNGDLNFSTLRKTKLYSTKDLRTNPKYSNYRLPTIGDRANPGGCPETTGKKYVWHYTRQIDSRIPSSACPGLSAQSAGYAQYVMTYLAAANAKKQYKIYVPDRNPKTGALVYKHLVNKKEVPCRKNGGPCRHLLSPTDEYVSMHDIYKTNNAVQNWGSKSKNSIYYRGTVDFTAQLSLAASYGYLQMTYVTAISKGPRGGDWTGVDASAISACNTSSNPAPGGQNETEDPYYLFDTECNLAHGGGSLRPGTHMLITDFATRQIAGSRNPRIADEQHLEALFGRAYKRYDPDLKGYGPSVLHHARSYEPIPSASIFSTGVKP